MGEVGQTDYVGTSGTLTFSPGQSSKTVTVKVIGDTTVEFNDTFELWVQFWDGLWLVDDSGRGTILNDDGGSAPKPRLTIDDVSQTEGDSGSKDFVFTVTMSTVSGTAVTVKYATANGTATAGSDYTAKSGTLTIPAGQTSGTIGVAVLGDTAREADETFTVKLSSAVGATIGDGTGVGTILNDDPLPVILIGDVTATEGNSGSKNFNFPVTLSNASSQSVTVKYATSNGTATAGTDYTAKSGTLTIPAGSTSGTIVVSVKGDTLVEPDETFYVNLSQPTGATIGNDQATGTLLNDDQPPGPPAVTLSAPDALASETGTVYAVAGGGIYAGITSGGRVGNVTIAGGNLSGEIRARNGIGNVQLTGLIDKADPYRYAAPTLDGMLLTENTIGKIRVQGGGISGAFLWAGNAIGNITVQAKTFNAKRTYDRQLQEWTTTPGGYVGGPMEFEIGLGKIGETLNPAARIGLIKGVGTDVVVIGSVPFDPSLVKITSQPLRYIADYEEDWETSKPVAVWETIGGSVTNGLGPWV